MRKEMKILSSLFLIALTLLIAGCSKGSTDKNEINIGILQVAPHASLDGARNGFETQLKKDIKKQFPSKKVTFTYLNAQGEQSNLKSMSDQLVNKKPDLLFGIGTPAAQALAKATKKIPIVVTAVTDLKGSGLVKSLKNPGTNVTGVSDAAPIKKQIDLLLSVVKSPKTIGFLYNAGEINSVIQVKQAEKILKAKGIKTKTITASSTNDAQSATQNIVKEVDGIYIPTDNLFTVAMPAVGKVVEANKIPLVGGSIDIVEKGGLTTFGINYPGLGKQAAQMAISILKDKKEIEKMPVETSNDLKLVVNSKMAKSLGIDPATIKEP